MMYRDIQGVQERIAELLEALRLAILADDTRDVEEPRGAAQAIALDIKRALTGIAGDEQSGTDLERTFTGAALNQIEEGLDAMQRVGLGVNVTELRARLLDAKTHMDFAAAYIRAALGFEDV